MSGVMPEAGDITICFECGSINRFGDDLEIIPCGDDVIESLDPETRDYVKNASRDVQRMRRFNLHMPDEDTDD